MDTILSRALREFTTGPLNQLIVNLGGHDGDQWEQQLKRFLRKEPCWIFTNNIELEEHIKAVEESIMIKIDRTEPFNLAQFMVQGSSIEEQDERALVITEVDLSKIRLETTLKPGETPVIGEERLKRLKKAGHIRLDAKVFQTLWENQSLIPEKWKEKTNGNTTYIFFDGTVLRDPYGDRFALCLYWYDGRWYWYYRWLDFDFGAGYPSAVLAS